MLMSNNATNVAVTPIPKNSIKLKPRIEFEEVVDQHQIMVYDVLLDDQPGNLSTGGLFEPF